MDKAALKLKLKNILLYLLKNIISYIRNSLAQYKFQYILILILPFWIMYSIYYTYYDETTKDAVIVETEQIRNYIGGDPVVDYKGKKKIISFIGSNGAGKSTLLSIITRTLSRDSGDVVIENKNLEEWKTEELAKVLSILKQSNHLNIRLTVKELVSFGRYPYSKGKLTLEDEEKVEQAIEYMGLKNLENRFIDELSGGQRQMAYIAMVIAQDTEYIFLDEPLNNLDMKHSVQIMKILRNLVDEKGKTISTWQQAHTQKGEHISE